MPAGEFSGGVDSHRMGKSNRLVVAIALVVFLGIGLRVVQYVANTSLWLDEIALVMGILDSDLVALLTQPLPFDQVAPKGFLLIQKLSVLAFGSSDYVLRLLPFLSSIVGLGAFWRLSTLMLPGTGALVAMLLFATAAPLIAFSGQAKQYSTDVCAALLLTLLAHHLISQKPTTRGTWLSAVGGTALLWLSQPAVLVAAGLAVPIALWMRADSQGARLRRIAIVTGAWGLSAAMVTGVGLASMSPSTRDYMQVFWADGFPDSLTEVVRARWAWNNIRLLFGSPPAGLAYPWPAFYATMAAMGLVVLWVQQRRVAVLLLGPMLAALGAAVAGQYPFSDRLILFLTPSMILAIGALIASGHRLVGRYSKPVAAVIALGLTAPALYPVVRSPPPYRIEHAKPVLAHLQENREATDAIYVYYGAAPVVGRYDASFGLSRAQYAVGGCHRGDSYRYLEELDNFRGHPRVWLVLTHSLPIYREREDILAYLDAIGSQKERLIVASHVVGRPQTPAEAYLYDLSATSKLASAKARTFALTGPDSVNSQGDCVNGPHVMITSDFECTGPPDTRCTRRPPASARAPAGER